MLRSAPGWLVFCTYVHPLVGCFAVLPIVHPQRRCRFLPTLMARVSTELKRGAGRVIVVAGRVYIPSHTQLLSRPNLHLLQQDSPLQQPPPRSRYNVCLSRTSRCRRPAGSGPCSAHRRGARRRCAYSVVHDLAICRMLIDVLPSHRATAQRHRIRSSVCSNWRSRPNRRVLRPSGTSRRQSQGCRCVAVQAVMRFPTR